MDKEAFKKFLRKKGKNEQVAERNCSAIQKFADFLHEEQNTNLVKVTQEDVKTYVEYIEHKKQSAKGALYSLMNYFAFIGNKELLQLASSLREKRTKKSRRIFPIKGFLDINQEYVKKLAFIGIKDVEQMLEVGKTKRQRMELAKQLDIPEEAILELVKLSDITRLGYVKAKLTRLYYNAGLDSPLKIAKFEPEELHAFFKKFVEKSGWDGMVPNPKDLIGNVASARKLKKVVEE